MYIYVYIYIYRDRPSILTSVAIPNLGHFQVGSHRYRSLIEGLYTYIEAL